MPKFCCRHFLRVLLWELCFTVGTDSLRLNANSAATAKAVYTPTEENVRFVGVINCKNSFCHGGASPGTQYAFSSYQYGIWSDKDYHSRSYATLTTAQSTRLAQNLQISSATESTRCTTCHAPMYEGTSAKPSKDPEALSPNEGPGVTVAEGVSCESCHNAAGFWLRGHTRADWTYTDRVNAGLNDMRNVYGRATTCVACHQVIDDDIIKAGHPELMFELDGQTASEPKHWRETDQWLGPKAWVVGQTVALHEITAQLDKVLPSSASRKNAEALNPISIDTDFLTDQQRSLIWLLTKLHHVGSVSTELQSGPQVLVQSEALGKQLAGVDWNSDQTKEALNDLAGVSDSFQDASGHITDLEQVLRAERLSMALDRLFKAVNKDVYVSATKEPSNWVYPPRVASNTDRPKGEAELKAIFAAVQDREKFDRVAFAGLLKQFATAISAK